MSFQFFSKLDNKFTDGPVSQLDPYRAVKSLIGGTGEMSRAISKTIQDDKRQSRMARRAYRSAMRSNDPNQIMAVSRFLTEQAEFNRPGVTGRPNNAVLIAGNEFQSRGGDLSRVQQGNQEFGSALENRSSGFGGVTNTQPGFVGSQSQGRLSAAEESKLKTRELTLAGNFGPRAQRELEAKMAREEGGSLFQKSSKEDGLIAGRLFADQKRAEDTAFFNQVEDEEKAIEAKSLEAKRIDARNGVLDGIRESRTVANPALDAAMTKLEDASNRTKESGDNREKAALERRAAFEARGKEIEAEKAAAIAAAEGRNSSALNKIEGGAKVREMQSEITDSYLENASITGGKLGLSGAVGDVFNKAEKPFIPHGVFGGELKKEVAGSPELFKKAINTASAFNEALGGKRVSVNYRNPTSKTRGPNRRKNKEAALMGENTTTYQADAFSPLKQKALGKLQTATGTYDMGNKYDADVINKQMSEAQDKIIKAAVDNKYPIELDGELMAIPEFRQKLADARVKSGMKTDKITGYTSFSFD
jgi:hypothetical protein